MSRRAAPAAGSLLATVLLAGCWVSPATVPATPAQPVTRLPPDPAPGLLDGRTNDAVTPATVQRTICTPGYTATIRPPEAKTKLAKASLIARQHPGTPLRAWILDHIIPLEGGGAPGSATDLRNFMLQTRVDAHAKDRVEDQMRDDICSGLLPLRTAQAFIAADWRTYSVQRDGYQDPMRGLTSAALSDNLGT